MSLTNLTFYRVRRIIESGKYFSKRKSDRSILHVFDTGGVFLKIRASIDVNIEQLST